MSTLICPACGSDHCLAAALERCSMSDLYDKPVFGQDWVAFCLDCDHTFAVRPVVGV